MTRRLGHRQRLVLNDLADQGRWRPNREIGRMTVSQTHGVLSTLDTPRGLAAYHEDGSRHGGYWCLTPAGYAELIIYAATDLGLVSSDTRVYEQLAQRIGHLAALARLAKDGPVNWKGQPVCAP